MKAIRIIAGDREYHLAGKEQLEELRDATVAAMKAGGGLVDFTDASGRDVSVVVSPGLAVAFEAVEIPDEPPVEAGARSPATEPGYEF